MEETNQKTKISVVINDKNIFFKFISPFLKLIDNGKFFRKPMSWLYKIFAVIFLIAPLYAFYDMVQEFDTASSGVIFGAILVWIGLVGICWFSFQLWWDRSKKVLETSKDNDEFVATPVLSHFVQTFGEWLGIFIAVFGFYASLIALIFAGSRFYFLGDFISEGAIALITLPILGFSIIVISRYLAELMRAIVAIANNTKK
ncbi:MAG: hypothetical protein M0P36_09185 [Bacteroidales bacterium]|jgi:hypothetical protein|nr:hypothetical protein [Bacteroidales bacterium]MDY0314427.1 hypothetical protein [Bacteroidales bacterium]